MEAQIGVRLAIRTTRGSQLTPAGIVVAEWAARLLEVADEIDAGLGSLRTEGRQRIRVVASQTIAGADAALDAVLAGRRHAPRWYCP